LSIEPISSTDPATAARRPAPHAPAARPAQAPVPAEAQAGQADDSDASKLRLDPRELQASTSAGRDGTAPQPDQGAATAAVLARRRVGADLYL
jgi:hypothetical protein